MSIVLLGSTSGSITLQEPAVAGTSVLTLPVGTGTVVANNVNSAIVSGTAVASTSGTSIDFTSIPSWVKRVTVMFSGVSTNGTSQRQVQLGTTSGLETTSYTSSGFGWTGGTNGSSSTTGILFDGLNPAAATAYNAVMIINSFGSNTWVASCLTAATTGTVQQFMTTGAKTLSATLDRVRITTVNGTDTFDAGSINILYE